MTVSTSQISPERISSALLTVNAPPSSKLRSFTCIEWRGWCQAQWQMEALDSKPRRWQMAVRKWNDFDEAQAEAGSAPCSQTRLPQAQTVARPVYVIVQLPDEPSNSILLQQTVLPKVQPASRPLQKMMQWPGLTDPSSTSMAYLRDLTPSPLSVRSRSTPMACTHKDAGSERGRWSATEGRTATVLIADELPVLRSAAGWPPMLQSTRHSSKD